MAKTVRAKYSKGIIEPLEPLWIEEGRELVVTIEEEMIPSALQRFEQAAGSWAGLIAEEEFLNDIYKARMLPRNEVKL